MTPPLLSIKNLSARVGQDEILRGINLTIASGEVAVLMGPNGSGKSTLAKVVLGHPAYAITSDTLNFDGHDLTALTTDERARLGIFLSFQQPEPIAGVTVASFLRLAYNAMRKAQDVSFTPVRAFQFQRILKEGMEQLAIDPALAERELNQDFSGGEKKKIELLQLMLLKPKLAIMDEIDSGVDVDALKVITEGLNTLVAEGMAVLIITHYENILRYITPRSVHLMSQGTIVRWGDQTLAAQIMANGFTPALMHPVA